jgi:rare lipoprotein A
MFNMSLRLGAALCCAALVFCCPEFSSAKLRSDGPPTKQSSSAKRRAHLSSVDSSISQNRRSATARAKPARNTAYVVIKPAPSAPRTVTGKASTYNPLRADDSTAGGLKTASGENYNPADWTAAIQTALRGLFKGIKFGKAYRPAFALVESNKKSAVVRINDVGPLKPGRIIDLNERAMRYFDPAMTRGVLAIKITPLEGSPAPGPVNRRAAGSVVNEG